MKTLKELFNTKHIDLTLNSIQSTIKELSKEVQSLKDNIASCVCTQELDDLNGQIAQLAKRVADINIPVNTAETEQQQEWRTQLEIQLEDLRREFL